MISFFPAITILAGFVVSGTSCFVPPAHPSTSFRWCKPPASPCGRGRGRRTAGVDVSMVRNIDLAEAIVFYGSNSIFESSSGSSSSSSDSITVLPGVEYLVEECLRDDTAVLAILEQEEEGPDAVNKKEQHLPKGIQVHYSQQPPPNPRDLWEAIHSVTIQPKGFGGSSGFGMKAADPERTPVPKHVVVLCDTEDKCRAARYAGMRVLCLQDNALADAIVNGWDEFSVDDIATPGSYWLNPPHPRDDDSNSVDPELVMIAYEKQQGDVSTTANSSSPSSSSTSSGPDNTVVLDEAMMSEDQLKAILADIDPL